LRLLRYLYLSGFLCLALAAGAAPCAAATPTTEHKLANGLRVIVKPDHRAPVVVAMLWYKVGSIDEFNGTTGIAHVVEHMAFKGTPTVGNGEYAKLISEAGGSFNAFTSHDATGYYAVLQKDRLPLALRLEADRMANLVLSPEEFKKEIRVVMEERRLRTEDRPRGLVSEQLMATALTAHPYRAPIIGWMNDLENMRIEEVTEFYRRWYSPNNALLVVVGDVEPRAVLDLVETHFGPIQARPLPERKPQAEPAQRGLRRAVVKAPAELPYLSMAFHTPLLRDAERDTEPYALSMLATVLSGSDASRFPRTLVREERLASNASASYDGMARGPGFFYLGGTPTPGRTIAELEQALRREMAKIIESGVSREELERAQAQAVAAQVYQRDSMMYQARQIGIFEISGIPHDSLDLQIRKLREVTSDQVREVARKYFRDDALTIIELDPQPLQGRLPKSAEGPADAR
jgi:zinc protease